MILISIISSRLISIICLDLVVIIICFRLSSNNNLSITIILFRLSNHFRRGWADEAPEALHRGRAHGGGISDYSSVII